MGNQMGSKKNRSEKTKRRARITPRRTTLLQKLAYILRPFVLYMLVKTAAMLFLAIAIPALPIAGITAWVERNVSPLSAVVNGAASLLAVGFLLNDFLIEANTDGEVDIDKNMFVQFASFLKATFCRRRTAQKKVCLALCVPLGITAALSLNILIALAAGNPLLDSKKYQAVEAIQYSVPVWLGIVLYGVVSPLVEEMVFRGVIYNRIKKFYSAPRAVVFSALLFGMFHANLPQFLYGTAMGILMAVCYGYCGSFAAPVWMHVAVNVVVFLLSGWSMWTDFFVTPFWGFVFAAASAGLMTAFIKLCSQREKTQKEAGKNAG